MSDVFTIPDTDLWGLARRAQDLTGMVPMPIICLMPIWIWAVI